MKLISFNLFVFAILLSFLTLGQSDSIPSHEDVTYIEPEVVQADLAMITAPVGFEVSDRFNGYIQLQTASGIIMTLIKDVTYMNIVKGMNEEFYQKNSLSLISETKLESNFGVKGRVYKFSFQLEKMEFIRYMVYAGDLSQTLWLNITYPKDMDEILEGEILKCIQTINLKPNSINNEE